MTQYFYAKTTACDRGKLGHHHVPFPASPINSLLRHQPAVSAPICKQLFVDKFSKEENAEVLRVKICP